MSSEQIDTDFEAILNTATKYTTKREMRLRKIIEDKFAEKVAAMQFITQNLEVCEIGGNQTEPVNLSILEAQIREQQERLDELQNQLVGIEDQVTHIEVDSLPEKTARDIKRIKKQIAELRASGITTIGPQHVTGISYDSSEPFDPMKQSDALCNFTYGAIHGNLLNELKQKQIELGIRDQPTVEAVDVGSGIAVFDDSKCAEAFTENGKIVQCPNFRFGTSKYCKKHLKTYEDKTIEVK